MKFNSMITLVLMLLAIMPVKIVAASEASCPDTLKFTKRALGDEKPVNLCQEYLGKVVMVVNTASKCGYTYQYEGLEALYSKYKDQGLVVIGFPSNDFGGQEPGTEKQIKEFCKLTYGVKFPMFEKTHAAQKNADPMYQILGNLSGEFPQWNFHKYILDRNGKLVASFNSKVEPQAKQVITTIEGLL